MVWGLNGGYKKIFDEAGELTFNRVLEIFLKKEGLDKKEVEKK